MTKTATLSAIAAILAMAAFPVPASAGNSAIAGIAGFGIGAVVGSALAPREVYVVPPPPPPPVYYAPAAYGPPPWSPGWYGYCSHHYASFNPQTGYFVGPDGVAYFCR